MSDLSILKKYNDQLFYKIKLRIKFRELVLAGIPKAGNPLDYFMSARHMSDDMKEDFKKRIADGTLTEDEKAAIKEMNWCTFERDRAGNLAMWHGNVKAMMREIFVTLGFTQRRPNTKKAGPVATKGKGKGKGKKDEAAALPAPETPAEDPLADLEVTAPIISDNSPSAGGRQTFQHAVHVDPGHIPFERTVDGNIKFIKAGDGQIEVTAPSEDHLDRKDQDDDEERKALVVYEKLEFLDKVKHIKDMNGTRSALGRHDKLDQPEMTIYLKWPDKGVFNEEDMKLAWSACEDDGLGACRSQGFGKFDVIFWEVTNDPKKPK